MTDEFDYTEQFFQSYRDYLQEPTVVARHRFAINALIGLDDDSRIVVDVGCGLGEYLLHQRSYKPKDRYWGLDKCAAYLRTYPDGRRIAPVDITNIHDVDTVLRTIVSADFRFNTLISLFALELLQDAEKNQQWYEHTFMAYPHLNQILVSGIYYESKCDQEIVQEACGPSYQSIAPIHTRKSQYYYESRLTLPVPSKMFGQDVYEVWKLLDRQIKEVPNAV